MKLLAGVGVLMSAMCGLGEKTAAVEFAAAKSYTVGTGPVGVAVGDFNGDGKMDQVVANAGSANVSVLLGNGDGTFQSAVNFEAGITTPGTIAVGDFNGDGKLDVAVFAAGNAASSVAGAVSVLLGNGDGTFQAGKVTNLTIYTTQIGVADFNGDKKSDLVVIEFNTASSLSVQLGNGDGTFGAPKVLTSPACTGVGIIDCGLFAAEDFDKDGKVDLALAGTGGVQILLGNGDGSFRTGATLAVTDGFTVTGISTTDFNGDGVVDLVVRSAQSNCSGFNCRSTGNTSVFLGNGNGTFGSEKIFFTGSSSRNEFGFGGSDAIANILAGDFNGDGKMDIVDRHGVKTSSFPGSPIAYSLELRLGRGDGSFAPAIELPDAGVIGAVGKFNSDSLTDLVAIGTSNNVDVLINNIPMTGADVSLTQASTSPEPVGVGQNLTYSATIINEGPEDATGVTFKDTLPAGLNYVSATSTSGSCTQASQVVTCSIGALKDVATAKVTIVATPAATGTVSNTMRVTATSTDGDEANNSTTQTSSVQPVHTLTVTKNGSGTGTVTASVGVSNGINCGSVCTEKYLEGRSVNLGVSADANSVFDSWSGACTGEGCSVTMDGDKTVTATFALTPDFTVSPAAANLMVTRGGQGSEQINFPTQGEFTGMITVTCSVSGATPTPTCGVTPGSVAAGGSVELAVNATGLSAALRKVPPAGFGVIYAVGLPFWIAGCLLGAGFDKKRARKWLACVLVIVACMFPVACGGGGSSKPVAQNYVITVTGVSGSITHTASVDVAVE
jgi:uncharacterized repeat protein (TIGR01451 family)